jgi:hypothetical protein
VSREDGHAGAVARATSYHGTISVRTMPVHLGRKDLAMNFYGLRRSEAKNPDKPRIF